VAYVTQVQIEHTIKQIWRHVASKAQPEYKLRKANTTIGSRISPCQNSVT